MKILEVISDLSLKAGGPPVSVIANGSALTRRGHQVTVATTSAHGEQLDLDIRTGAIHSIHTFPCWHPEKFAFSPELTRFLWKQIPTVDVVILHGLYLYPTTAAAWICRHFGVPYIMEPHGSLDPFIHKRHRLRKAVVELAYQNSVTRHASGIWFSSAEEAVLAKPFILGRPFFVAPHAVDLTPFTACRNRKPFEEIFANATILFYGRVNFKKGLDLLIEAFAMLKNRGLDCRLVVAGPVDAEMIPRLAEWEAKFGVRGLVEYLGMVSGSRRLDVLSEATVFALPSYSENFGIAVIEAIAAGLPVVISDQVNIHPDISAANVGLVTACNATAVADALQKMLSDKDLNRQYRRNADDFLAKRYSQEVNAGILEAGIVETIRRYRAR